MTALLGATPAPAAFTEKVLQTYLTADQRANLILEPELADAFYGQVDRIYLHGYWKFKPEINLMVRQGNSVVATNTNSSTAPASDPGLAQGYYNPSFNTTSWDQIPVPWSWNITAKISTDTSPSNIAFAGLGYYRTTFSVPSAKSGKRVILHFDSVQTECKVWLNGVQVGEHVNNSSDGGAYWSFNRRLLLDDFELDVTSQVTFGGNNTLVLRVYDDGLPIVDGKPNGGGIIGPAWVEFREAVNFPEILVDGNPSSGAVTLRAHAVNHGTAAVSLTISAVVEPFTSRFYTPPAAATATTSILGRVTFVAGESDHPFTFTVSSPVAWDLNQPALYRLRLVDEQQRILGQTRFGFRRVTVSGTQFQLNGHSIYLRGVNPGSREYQGSRMNAFNKGNWYREGMKLFKDLNLNLRRTNNGPSPRIAYEICDEIGLLNEEDFSLQTRALSTTESNAELIAEAMVDDLVNTDGTLTTFGQTILRKWVVQLHNHPSVALLTAGNEIGFLGKEAQLSSYMTAFYNYVKSIDLQQRPITPSSGLTIWQWSTPLPANYLDHHDYGNGDLGYMDCSGPIGSFAQTYWNHIYGTIDKPLVLGECGGYESYQTLRPDLQALATNGVLNRSAYVSWANTLATVDSTNNYWDYIPRMFYASFAGIRGVVSKDALVVSTAKLYPEFIRRMRRDAGYLQGLVVHDLDPLYWGLTGDLFLKESQSATLATQCRSHAEFLAEQQALAPLVALTDLHDRHRFAGENLAVLLRLINDQYAKPETNLVVDVTLETAGGSSIATTQSTFASVPEYARIDRTLTLAIPSATATGNYLLHTRLRRSGTVVHETITPFYVLGPDKPKPTITTSRKIALYESTGLTATKAVLDDLTLSYTKISNMDTLATYDLLVIGANSLDTTLSQTLQSSALRTWIEQGGRVICLEQNRVGSIPFASEINIKSAGDMLFADVIDTTHPALTGIQSNNFEVWNGACTASNGGMSASAKAVYTNFITPLPNSVVISGGDRARYRWMKNPKFGMVLGEVKIGNGLAILSQPLATSRYGKDPTATLYLRNLLSYALGAQWDGSRATDITAYWLSAPVGKIASLTATAGSVVGEITLTWSAAANANVYRIDCSYDGGTNFYEWATVSNTLSYTVSVWNFHEYLFRVRGQLITNLGEWSPTVSYTLQASTMADWRYLLFGTTEGEAGYSGDLDMPYGDGVTNLMRYALGYSLWDIDGNFLPLSPTSLPYVQEQTIQSNRYLTCTFTHNKSASDLVYRVEVASEPGGPWTSLDPFDTANQASVLDNTPSNGVETVVVKDTQPITSSNKRFMRVRVTH